MVLVEAQAQAEPMQVPKVTILYLAPSPQLVAVVAVAHLQLVDSPEVLVAAAAVVEMAHRQERLAALEIRRALRRHKAATAAVEVRR